MNNYKNKYYIYIIIYIFIILYIYKFNNNNDNNNDNNNLEKFKKSNKNFDFKINNNRKKSKYINKNILYKINNERYNTQNYYDQIINNNNEDEDIIDNDIYNKEYKTQNYYEQIVDKNNNSLNILSDTLMENDNYYYPNRVYNKKHNYNLERDYKILYDRLYPPLGRIDRTEFDILTNLQNNNKFNMYTRGTPDTYRVLGYLTPIDTNNLDSTLILYGRSIYTNSDIGEFYVSSSNKLSDIKVPLNNNNSNIKRITDIPNIINITGNILNGSYNFIELPKANLSYPYL